MVSDVSHLFIYPFSSHAFIYSFEFAAKYIAKDFLKGMKDCTCLILDTAPCLSSVPLSAADLRKGLSHKRTIVMFLKVLEGQMWLHKGQSYFT